MLLTVSFLLLLEVLVIAFQERPAAVATYTTRTVIRSGHNEKDILTKNPTKRDFSDQDTINGCRKFGDCSPYSSPYIIDQVLGNLTSNSVIKITQDVILS